MPNKKKNIILNDCLAANRLVGTRFLISGGRIGNGNFGEVRLGIDVKTKEKVAIKMEKKVVRGEKQLKKEFQVLRSLRSARGFPAVLEYGQCGSVDCLVMEVLGPNLADLLQFCGGKFSLKTTLILALQILDRLETLHNVCGHVYRDIKPENFLIRGSQGTASNMIYMIDFGLAVPFMDGNDRHILQNNEKKMVGTLRFMSISAHRSVTQGRKDDLESLCFMLIFFLKGSLPWMGLTGSTRKEKYRKIKNSKLSHPPNILCQFREFLRYSRSLSFSDTPQYSYLKQLLHDCYEEQGYSYHESELDWSSLSIPSNLYKVNLEENSASSADTEDDINLPEDESLYEEEILSTTDSSKPPQNVV